MSDILDAPVIGYRRWKVNADGWLEGYGVPIPWKTGTQTAQCHGQQSYVVAEYCDPPKPKPYNQGGGMPSFYDEWLGWSDRPSRLPDGRWVKRVSKKSCNDPSLLPLEHPVPSLNSRCGIWAHKQPIPDCTCPEPTAARHGAVGVVRMTGRGVEHEDGWRAEHAELVALVDHTNRVRRDYWVPRYATTAEMYAEWAPGHDGWAARHDACWCDHGSGLVLRTRRGHIPTSILYSFYYDLLSRLGLALGAGSGSHPLFRNANHPGQDRPEKSRRKRKGFLP